MMFSASLILNDLGIVRTCIFASISSDLQNFQIYNAGVAVGCVIVTQAK